MHKIKNIQYTIYIKRSEYTAKSANCFADLNIFDE